MKSLTHAVWPGYSVISLISSGLWEHHLLTCIRTHRHGHVSHHATCMQVHTHALTPTAEAYPQFNATQYANTGFMCQ